MGDFRIVIEAVGGHGCQRSVPAGGAVGRCENEHCPDCKAREFVSELKRSNNVSKAELIHWPAHGTAISTTPGAVIVRPKDDLLGGTRVVPFPEAMTDEQKAGPPIDWDAKPPADAAAPRTEV